MSLIRRSWPVLVLAFAPILPLWPAIFGGLAIGPWDQIRTMAPWNGPAPSAPWDVLQADAVLQFAPWRSMVFQAWSQGQLPLWNPYQLMGTPLLANSQSAAFYPPHILMGILKVPVYPAITFLAWLHLFWAGLGVYLLVRRLGGVRVGGVVAGVSFSLSAFMVSWTSLPSVITTVSWIPWCLACALAIFQTGLFWAIYGPPRSFQPESLSPQEALGAVLAQQIAHAKWTGGLLVCIGMLILAGHLQFAAYGLLALFLFVLVLVIRTSGFIRDERVIRVELKADGRRERVNPGAFGALVPALFPAARCLVAAVLGFCLAAPQLLPVLAFSRHSHRQSHPTADGYADYVNGGISPLQLSGLVYPTVLGHPEQPSNVLEGANSYWPAYEKRGADFSESALGIGPLILALLFCLRKKDWRRLETAGFAAIGVLGLLIALGTPFDRLLYFGVPGWAATGSPGRAGILFVLSACVLGGLGASSLLREGLPGRRWVYPSAALVFGLLTCVIPTYADAEPIVSKAIAGALISGLPFILATGVLTGLLILLRTPPISKRIAFVVGCLTLGPLLVNGVFPLAFGKPLEKPNLQPDGRFAAINNNWQLAIREPAVVPGNLASLFGLHDVAGYDSLLDRDTKSALDAANHTDSSPPTNGNMLFVKPSADPKALAELGVTEVWTQSGLAQLPGPGRITSPKDDARIEEEGFDHITMSATGPGTLTLRDRNMEGWSAQLDGTSLAIKPGFFREVELPEGSHRLKFRYVPPGLALGLELFVVGLIGLALVLVPGFKRPASYGPK